MHHYPASLDHAHAIIRALDDLEGSVDVGGFGEGFHEGIVPLVAVENLKNTFDVTAYDSTTADSGKTPLQN